MKNVKKLLLLGVMLVNVMPYLKDGKVEWKAAQVEAQTFTCEGMVGNNYRCVNDDDPTEVIPWSKADCIFITICSCSYCKLPYDCADTDTCMNMACPKKTHLIDCSCCHKPKLGSLNGAPSCADKLCPCCPDYILPMEGGGGGGGGTQQPSTTIDPCADSNTMSTAAQTSLNNLMSNYDPNTKLFPPIGKAPDPNNHLRLNNLSSYATASTTTTEIAFVAAQYESYSGTNYYYTEGISGSEILVRIPSYSPTVATFHNHSKGSSTNPNLTGPSPGDFLGMLKNREFSGATNLNDAYIYAYDGSVYDLHVTDPSAATTFYNNNKETLFTDAGMEANGHTFATGSTWLDTYNSVFSKAKIEALKSMNEAQAETQAHDYAMAYIMKQAGISLLKKDPGSDTSLKKMNTNASQNTTTPYTFIKCP